MFITATGAHCISTLCLGIQHLVLAGRMGEAIDATYDLYPGILETNPNLLFMLKCRQFIEMVNGTDSQVLSGGKTANSCSRSDSHQFSSTPAMSSPRSVAGTSPSNNSSSSNHDQLQPQNSHPVMSHSHGDSDHLHIIPPPPSKSSSRASSASPQTSPRERNSQSHKNSRNAAMNGQSWSSSNKNCAPHEEQMDTSGDSNACSSRDVVNGASMNGVNNHHSKPVHHYDMGEKKRNLKLDCVIYPHILFTFRVFRSFCNFFFHCYQ